MAACYLPYVCIFICIVLPAIYIHVYIYINIYIYISVRGTHTLQSGGQDPITACYLPFSFIIYEHISERHAHTLQSGGQDPMTACYLPSSFPSMLQLAYKYSDSPGVYVQGAYACVGVCIGRGPEYVYGCVCVYLCWSLY